MVFTMIRKIMRILPGDGCGAVALKQLVYSSFSIHKITKVITMFRDRITAILEQHILKGNLGFEL